MRINDGSAKSDKASAPAAPKASAPAAVKPNAKDKTKDDYQTPATLAVQAAYQGPPAPVAYGPPAPVVYGPPAPTPISLGQQLANSNQSANAWATQQNTSSPVYGPPAPTVNPFVNPLSYNPVTSNPLTAPYGYQYTTPAGPPAPTSTFRNPFVNPLSYNPVTTNPLLAPFGYQYTTPAGPPKPVTPTPPLKRQPGERMSTNDFSALQPKQSPSPQMGLLGGPNTQGGQAGYLPTPPITYANIGNQYAAYATNLGSGSGGKSSYPYKTYKSGGGGGSDWWGNPSSGYGSSGGWQDQFLSALARWNIE